MDGFIIPFWNTVFRFLEKVSLFYWLKKHIDIKKQYTFVEFWVFGNLIASILFSYIVYHLTPRNQVFIWFILGYSALRVFEIIVYQINVLLFHEIGVDDYHIKSAKRTLILLLHNFAEIIFWYSAIQMSLLLLSGYSLSQLWIEYVRLNFYCIATFDSSIIDSYYNYVPRFIANLTFFEILSGIIITIISLSRFISLLPPVKQIDSRKPDETSNGFASNKVDSTFFSVTENSFSVIAITHKENVDK